MLITSRENPKIKQARSLLQRKGREAAGLFLAEGIRHVGEAVEAAARPGAHVQLEYLLYAPDLLTSEYAQRLVQQQEAKGVPCYALSPGLFESLTSRENPQGILAVTRLRQPSLSEMDAAAFPWCVALVAPQDPGNVGTILRTLDAVGASALLLLESSADPYHPSSVRASMGAIFWLPLIKTSFTEFAAWTKSRQYSVYGTSARGSLDYREVEQYARPLVLLLGSEREGLTPEQASICQTLIRLPMKGRSTSLNLAVAAGVFLYEILAKQG